MPLYKFVIDLADEKALLKCMRYILRVGTISSATCLDTEAKPPEVIVAAKGEHLYFTRPSGYTERRKATEKRNQEIIEKYLADPKAHSCQKLGDEYGLSRERICQILRPVNAIGTAQGRREAAKEALTEASAKLKEETLALWETKLSEALELVRGGQSARQASAAVGFDSHGNFTNTLNRRCRLAGIPIKHGRWKDMSERKERVRTLAKTGLTIPKIVEHLRKNEDPHIYESWVYNNLPELKTQRRTGKAS